MAMTSDQYAKEYEAVFGKTNDIVDAFNAGFECGRNATKEACIPIMWLADHILSATTFRLLVSEWNKDKNKYGG